MAAPKIFVLEDGRDPWRVLGAWYLRKFSLTLLWLGFIAALVIAGGDDFKVDLETPEGIWRTLRSPAAPILVAVGVRLLSGFVALIATVPAARMLDDVLEHRDGRAAWIGDWYDRLNIARAYRAMRWTHGVRMSAIRSLGDAGARVAVLDPVLDTINILLPVAMIAIAVILR